MLSFLRSQIEGRVCGKAAEMGEQEGWARITALKELKGEVRPPARCGRGSACAARAGAAQGVWRCAVWVRCSRGARAGVGVDAQGQPQGGGV